MKRFALVLTTTVCGILMFSSSGNSQDLGRIPGLTKPSRTENACLQSQLGAIDHIDSVGTGYEVGQFCAEGHFSITCQPKSSGGSVIVSNLPADIFGCSVSVLQDNGTFSLPCKVEKSECSVAKDQSAILVILDDSGSMSSSNSGKIRGEACRKLVNTLQDEDIVMVASFSQNSPSAGLKKLRVLSDFGSERSASLKACGTLISSGGTPLYQSVNEGLTNLIAKAKTTYTEASFSMLLLSDGVPDSNDIEKEAAIKNAKELNVPIYTVGLGVAAGSNPTAVTVLQELSQFSKGSYVAANKAEELEQVFKSIAGLSTEGRCRIEAKIDLNIQKLNSGDTLSGNIFVNGAKSPFTFKVPEPITLDQTAVACFQ